MLAHRGLSDCWDFLSNIFVEYYCIKCLGGTVVLLLYINKLELNLNLYVAYLLRCILTKVDPVVSGSCV